MAKLKPDEARQAKKGTPVLLILIVGLVLCILGFVVFGLLGTFETSPDLSNAQNSQEVATPAENGNNATPADSGADETLVSPPGTEKPGDDQ